MHNSSSEGKKSHLAVKFGVAEDKLIQLIPNDDEKPGFVNSDHFSGYVTVRMAKPHATFVGENTPIPETDYFKEKSRMFSLQFSGRFKATNPNHPKNYWTADDVQYVMQFDGPIKSSRSVSIVTKIVMMIDPTMELQYIHQQVRPYVASYVFTSCNVLSGHKIDPEEIKTSNIPTDPSRVSTTDSPPLDPGPWKFGGARFLEEDLSLFAPELDDSVTKKVVPKRRAHFNDPANRKNLELHPDIVVGCDQFNPNFNPANAYLEMSSILRFDTAPILNNQPLRWVVRAKDNPDAVFFVVEVDYAADTR